MQAYIEIAEMIAEALDPAATIEYDMNCAFACIAGMASLRTERHPLSAANVEFGIGRFTFTLEMATIHDVPEFVRVVRAALAALNVATPA